MQHISGRNTYVQDVLRDMRDAGYISLEARKRAQVIWQPSQAHDEQTDFYILHTHRQMIDVLESMRLCLPPSAAGCAIYCRKRISAIYIKCCRRWRIIKIWKTPTADPGFNVYLLQRYHNDMILDLYLTTFSYIEYPCCIIQICFPPIMHSEARL